MPLPVILRWPGLNGQRGPTARDASFVTLRAWTPRRSREGYDYFNAYGRPAEAAFTPDVVLVEADPLPVGGRTYEGYDGVLAALAQLIDAFEEVQYEPREFVQRDDRVLVHLRLTGRGRGSGRARSGGVLPPVHATGGRADRALGGLCKPPRRRAGVRRRPLAVTQLTG
jgi:hypothetical protein